MARKGLLDSVLNADTDKSSTEKRSDYAMRGASRSMKLSIDDMAENVKRMAEGETIMNIAPSLIESSFVQDRLALDDEEFEALKKTISEQGQQTPVLLRPHPQDNGRYMVVFGHRRVRAATALGLDVKAIIKPMEDVAHVIAQGQENTARANLSFIEKALFAKKLLDMDQSKETIMSALTIDATLLSRMLSITQKVPLTIIEEIGAAKTIGRDRWEELKRLIIVPANNKKAHLFIKERAFTEASSDERFEMLLTHVRTKGSATRKTRAHTQQKAVWQAGEGAIQASHGKAGKAYSISLTLTDADDFGEYVSSQLDTLYREFKSHKAGDKS